MGATLHPDCRSSRKTTLESWTTRARFSRTGRLKIMVAIGGIAEHYIGASISLAGVNLADTYSPPGVQSWLIAQLKSRSPIWAPISEPIFRLELSMKWA